MSGEVDAPEGDLAWALSELRACREEILSLRRTLQGRTIIGDTLAFQAHEFFRDPSLPADKLMAAIAGWKAS